VANVSLMEERFSAAYNVLVSGFSVVVVVTWSTQAGGVLKSLEDDILEVNALIKLCLVNE
jgi:hypothetical protein